MWWRCHARAAVAAEAGYARDLVDAETLSDFEERMRYRAQQHPATHAESLRAIERSVRTWQPEACAHDELPEELADSTTPAPAGWSADMRCCGAECNRRAEQDRYSQTMTYYRNKAAAHYYFCGSRCKSRFDATRKCHGCGLLRRPRPRG